jgi:hypothetical protein
MGVLGTLFSMQILNFQEVCKHLQVSMILDALESVEQYDGTWKYNSIQQTFLLGKLASTFMLPSPKKPEKILVEMPGWPSVL